MLRIEKTKVGDRFICKLPIEFHNSKYFPLNDSYMVVTQMDKGDSGETRIHAVFYKGNTKSVEKILPEYTHPWFHFIDGGALQMSNMHKIETTDIHKALSDLDFFITDAYTKEKEDIKRDIISVKAITPMSEVVHKFYITYGKKDWATKLDALNDLKISLSYLKFNLHGLVNMRIITPHAVANITLFLNNVHEQIEKWEASMIRKINAQNETQQEEAI